MPDEAVAVLPDDLPPELALAVLDVCGAPALTDRVVRGYPDPLEYSWHGGGLPSSVQIYAMTLERADVDIDIQPDQFGYVWTAPATPSYTIQLRNRTGQSHMAGLSFACFDQLSRASPRHHSSRETGF